ncbi:Remorin 4.1, partial [Mucuna pruriens]
MRYVEDKGCYNNHGPTQEAPNSSAMYSEFHKGKDATRVSHSHHRTTMGKPTPSKWDDAQKWLVGLSKGGEKSHSKSKPRNSNADDLRLIAPVPQKDHDYSSSEKEEEENDSCHDFMTSTATSIAAQYEAETKRVECDESIWRSSNNNRSCSENTIQVQPICFRDMGTEMTPIASQEPSRTGTPIRATTPATRSPIHSGTSTPMRGQNGLLQVAESDHGTTNQCGERSTSPCNRIEDQARKLSSLESRAMAWDEAERAKYMARFKREEVKIQAWENHQIRKAEMEMKKMEVKAERMKALAQERFANKLAATKRIGEEKRANAQIKMNDKALRTTERVEYIKRTGHVPSSFSFNIKLPFICW